MAARLDIDPAPVARGCCNEPNVSFFDRIGLMLYFSHSYFQIVFGLVGFESSLDDFAITIRHDSGRTSSETLNVFKTHPL